MDQPIKEANRLIQKLLKLNPITDKRDWEGLISQVWGILDNIVTLENKVYFLVSLKSYLDETDKTQACLRRTFRNRSLELISEFGMTCQAPEEYLAKQVIQQLIQLDSNQNQPKYDELKSQLWNFVEFWETLERKLLFLINLGCSLSQEETNVNKNENFLRRELATRILQLIDDSGKLWHHPDDYAGEAWKRTLEYLYRHLERYDPTKATVVTWVNNYYRWRGIDERNGVNARNPNIIDVYPDNDDEDKNDIFATIESKDFFNADETLELLKKIRFWAGEGKELVLVVLFCFFLFSKNELHKFALIFIQKWLIFIEEWLSEFDPELQTIYVKKDRTDVTAAMIILRRLPPEEAEWQEIAEEFNLKVVDKKTGELKPDISSLSSFWERHCRPRIMEYVLSLGYERPDTPVDPVQDIKLIINKVKKIYKADNIVEELKDWINNNSELKTIVCKPKQDLTANIFLNETLSLLKENRQFRLEFFIKHLNNEQSQAEDIIEQLEKWINKNTFLPKLTCEDNTDVTAEIFLKKLLSLLKDNQSVQIRSLVRELNINTRESNNMIERIEEWISNNSNLQKIISKSKLYFTSDYFLNQLLFLGENQKKLQTKFFANELNIAVTQAEKFYEFRCQPQLHNFLRTKGYNLSLIYN